MCGTFTKTSAASTHWQQQPCCVSLACNASHCICYAAQIAAQSLPACYQHPLFQRMLPGVHKCNSAQPSATGRTFYAEWYLRHAQGVTPDARQQAARLQPALCAHSGCEALKRASRLQSRQMGVAANHRLCNKHWGSAPCLAMGNTSHQHRIRR